MHFGETFTKSVKSREEIQVWFELNKFMMQDLN
jgi:hypothetical protein